MHALVAAAVVLAALPALAKALAFVALLGHAAVRRPRAAPSVLRFAADGSCAVPEWRTAWQRLGPDTLICPYWIRIHLNRRVGPRYILLFADQVAPHEWRRLRALLRRSQSD